MRNAKRSRGLRTLSCLIGVFFGSLICEIGSANAASERFPYESAVEYCRGNVTRPVALNDDRTIVCFDGEIIDDQDLSTVENLKENGLFIVRSSGGSRTTAIALAGLLRDRNAIVVVYDYCNSACASYLFIATDRTVVRKNSIVAWHFARGNAPLCPEMKSYGDDGPKRLQISPCPFVPREQQTLYRKAEALSLQFYKERTLAPGMFGQGFDLPQSSHVTRMLKSMLDGTGEIPTVAWMWNPRFYKSILKTMVSYEAYPGDQAEVDAIAAQLGFGRVIHDP
jgi:hypothetical protein